MFSTTADKNPTKANSNSLTSLFQFACVFALLGLGLRGVLHDLPLRALVWDAAWFGFVPDLLGMSWTDWVTSARVDRWVEAIDFALGCGLCFLALFIMLPSFFTTRSLPRFFRRAFNRVHWVACLPLFIALLNWKAHFWQIGQLLESALLVGIVPLYVLSLWSAMPPAIRRWFHFVTRLLVALTFTGHGLYAIGFHAVPAHFVMMTQSGLGLGEFGARRFLFGVGILDFVAAALLMLPSNRAQRIALGWIIPWALLTTLARVWSYGGLVSTHTLLTQWLPETIIRLPHILVPLALLFRAGPRVQRNEQRPK